MPQPAQPTGGPRRQLTLSIPLELVRRACVVLLAVAAGVAVILLYEAQARGTVRHTLVIVQDGTPSGASLTTAATAARTSRPQAAARPRDLPNQTAPAVVPTPAPTPPLDDADLLPNGSSVATRLAVSLDRSPTGQIALAGTIAGAAGCDRPVFVIATLQSATWQPSYSADGVPDGAAVQPCGAPQLLAAASGEDGRAELLVVVQALADGTQFARIFGWDGQAATPSVLYARRSAPHPSAALSPDGTRLLLREDALVPNANGANVPVGILTEVVELRAGRGVTVAGDWLAPPCDRGRLTNTAALSDPVRPIVVLLCPDGSSAIATLDSSTIISPQGIGLIDLHENDSLQVAFAAASLQLPQWQGTLPQAVQLTDYAAQSRQLAGGKVPRTATVPAPRLPSQTFAPSTRIPAASRPQSGAGDAAPLPTRQAAPALPAYGDQSGPSPRGSIVPAVTGSAPLRSTVPALPVEPAPALPPRPLVTAPPAPRSVPGVGPPPSAPH